MTSIDLDDTSDRRRDATHQAIGFAIVTAAAAIAIIAILVSGSMGDPILMGCMLSFGTIIPYSLRQACNSAALVARLRREAR